MKRETMFDEKLSRRAILKGVSGAAGIAVLASGGLSIFSKAEADISSTEKWPWPYEKLDPEKTAKIAYDEWYRIFCGAAVISSVFGQLRDKIGGPYKSFPIDAFVFLEGGVAGWGTICGSNAGANIVSNMIIGPRIAGPECENGAVIGTNIMKWYAETPMPVYLPKDPRVKTVIVKTTSDSPLCHVSVGKWMKASGFPFASAERKDRCAMVTASVAYKLVEDLNAWKDGKYAEKVAWSPIKKAGIAAQQNCTECHGATVPAPPSGK
jgi:hypothetical protein